MDEKSPMVPRVRAWASSGRPTRSPCPSPGRDPSGMLPMDAGWTSRGIRSGVGAWWVVWTSQLSKGPSHPLLGPRRGLLLGEADVGMCAYVTGFKTLYRCDALLLLFGISVHRCEC